ncbi:hypothetical protein GF380_01495 [Candidatus Uhrbacteria bacterium]|nr:hypothetical protein [Candidatus Uhrbacteria bacterium]
MKALIPGSIENGLQIWQRDATNGYAMGQDKDLADGSTSHSYVIRSANILPLSQEELEAVEFIGGGNVSLGTLYRGATEFGPVRVNLDEQDDGILAVVGGKAVSTTYNAGWRTFAMRVEADSAVIGGAMFSYQMTPVSGSQRYRNIIFPKSMNVPSARNDDPKLVSDLLVAPQRTDTTAMGEAMSNVVTWNEAGHYIIDTENQLGITTFVCDGTGTTFVTAYKPVGTTVGTTGDNAKNWITRNGTIEALDSAATTGTMTLSSAGTAGDVIVCFYEHNFVTV